MSGPEFVGFLITIVALLFLFLKSSWEEKKRRQNPDKYVEEEKKRKRHLRKLLKEINIETDVDDKEDRFVIPSPVVSSHNMTPPHIPGPKIPSSPKSMITTQNFVSSNYHVIQKDVPSRGAILFRHLKSPQEMVILREILGPPKGLVSDIRN
jgi:hypothetical protein